MQNDVPSSSVAPDSWGRKHESGDPRVRWIALAAAWVVMLMLGCLAIIWVMMGAFSKTRPLKSKSAESRGIIATTPLEMPQRFPGPDLQTEPRGDLVALLSRENAELNSYGWIDRSNGIVRIPIERAMDLVAQRGLPARSRNAPARTGKSSLELIRERSQTR